MIIDVASLAPGERFKTVSPVLRSSFLPTPSGHTLRYDTSKHRSGLSSTTFADYELVRHGSIERQLIAWNDLDIVEHVVPRRPETGMLKRVVSRPRRPLSDPGAPLACRDRRKHS